MIALAHSSNFLCSRLLKNLLALCAKNVAEIDKMTFSPIFYYWLKYLTLDKVIQRYGVSV
ncbi:hypothetical protein A6J64_008895 [Yersinia enterocolitica]|nr:hypothetical protein A6J64_008895 [Yersinia enterocolitica]PNM21066.1 hypothetical protein A6J65_021075 [Yersinia enterocolitica]PNM21836.1 hypothetical protein A6J63_002615 [Yersinia enterocolitica]RLY99779.1 hypothetical protein COO51_11680 [Yersinia enterocolitica]